MKYFYGEDIYAAGEAVTAYAVELKATVRWVDGEDLKQRPFSEWLDRGGSSLFGKEVIILRDPAALPKAAQEQVVAAIKEGREFVAWDRVTPDKRSALFKALKKHSQEFPQPDSNTLARWIVTQAQQRGGSIEQSAAAELVRRAGPDKWRLISELEKILLTHETISRQHVEEAAPPAALEGEIFALLDALSVGNLPRATTLMEALLEEGESEFYIISMLAYQLRTLLAIRTAQDQGTPVSAIAKQTGLHPYVVEKNTPAVRRLSAADMLAALTKIMATDFAIKQGKLDQRTGLIMLITSLLPKSAPVSGAR